MTAGKSSPAVASRRVTGAALNLGLKKMPIASPRYAFNAIMVSGAPPDPGVFALWQDEELIYYGRALGQGATIQSRLREHLEQGAHCTAGATHYGWEITNNPRAREGELLREHENFHGRLPRCNVKAAAA